MPEMAHPPWLRNFLISVASRSTSLSWCAAEKVTLRRAVPMGTVGGRMGTTRYPLSSRNFAAVMVRSVSPRMMGTIGLCAVSLPKAEVNMRALRKGSAAKLGSDSIRSRAAMAAATDAGAKPVE